MLKGQLLGKILERPHRRRTCILNCDMEAVVMEGMCLPLLALTDGLNSHPESGGEVKNDFVMLNKVTRIIHLAVLYLGICNSTLWCAAEIRPNLWLWCHSWDIYFEVYEDKWRCPIGTWMYKFRVEENILEEDTYIWKFLMRWYFKLWK